VRTDSEFDAARLFGMHYGFRKFHSTRTDS